MNYKKLLSVILCFVMLFSFSACQEQTSVKDDQSWMPFGLQFGMTYDEFSKQLSSHGIDAPALVSADANAGYVTDGVVSLDLADSTVWEFLDSKMLKKLAEEDIEISDDVDLGLVDLNYEYSSPAVYFSFNQNQQLYEFYCIWTCMAEVFPLHVIPEIITNYNTKLNMTGITSEYSGEWKTDEHGVSITYSEENSQMILSHHCFKFDLDS